MTITLPALRTLIIDPSFPAPSASTCDDKQDDLLPFNDKSQWHKKLHPSLPFPLPSHRGFHGDHGRRVSTCSMSSAPSLTYSPSPSPPPTRPASPDSFLLVPCAFHNADAVVIVGDQPSIAPDGRSSCKAEPWPTSPIFQPCKPSEARATLLIGPAISSHARNSATRRERRMHPYRIVRERRASP